MKKTILYLLLFCLPALYLQAQEENVSPPAEKYRIEKIFPNPAERQVTVEFYSEGFSFAQFELIDILGNRVKQWKKQEIIPGSQRITLDVQSLHAGFYLLKATIEGQVIVKRIRKI